MAKEKKLRMSAGQRLLYWTITGLLLGFGWASAWTIGLPFLIVGIGLLFYGMVQVGPTSFWAALVGFGIFPTIFLIRIYLIENRCLPGTGLFIPANAPAGTRASCSFAAGNFLESDAFFGGTALIGLVWGFVSVIRRRHLSSRE